MVRLEDYRQVAPAGVVDIILRLAERVPGRRVVHVTGGRFGGGIAETLRAAVPILGELGVEAAWEITGGDPAFYTTARALEAALAGA